MYDFSTLIFIETSFMAQQIMNFVYIPCAFEKKGHSLLLETEICMFK